MTQKLQLCVICSDQLSKEAIRPSKLLRHIAAKDPALKDNSELKTTTTDTPVHGKMVLHESCHAAKKISA